MGMFSNFFQKECSLGAQPHSGWSWSLSVNGVLTAHFDWEDVARALDGLGPHDDSFVILEQRKGKDYWFIQSAVALTGPHTGEYVVGVGCGGAGRAVDMFRAAWQGKPLDFTGFEDQSDQLPGES